MKNKANSKQKLAKWQDRFTEAKNEYQLELEEMN